MSDLSAEVQELVDAIDARTRARLDEFEDSINVRMRKLGARAGGAGEVVSGPRAFLRADDPFAPALRRAAAEHGRELETAFTEEEASQIRPGAILAAIASGNTKQILSNLSDPEIKALKTATGAEGGYLVDELIASMFIDAVRPASRVLEAGALTLPLDAPTVHLPGWADPITAEWVGELEARSETTSTFKRVTLTAKTVHTRLMLSQEMLDDAGNSFGAIVAIVQNEFARALGSAVDLAALVGTGTGAQPLGIYNTAGINETTLGAGSGATPADYDFLLDAMFAVEDANFSPTGVLWSARTANTLRKLKTGLSGDLTQLRMPAEVAALQRLTTNQVPNDLDVGGIGFSAAFVGQWDQLVLGFRPDMRVQTLTDPYTAASSGAVWLNARLRADVAMLDRLAFHVTKGIDD